MSICVLKSSKRKSLGKKSEKEHFFLDLLRFGCSEEIFVHANSQAGAAWNLNKIQYSQNPVPGKYTYREVFPPYKTLDTGHSVWKFAWALI